MNKKFLRVYLPVVLATVLCIFYSTKIDRNFQKVNLNGTVIAKSIIDGGKYSSKPTLAVKTDDGKGFDIETSFVTYSQFNISDKINFIKPKVQLQPLSLLELIVSISSFTISTIGTLVSIVLSVILISGKSKEFIEEFEK